MNSFSKIVYPVMFVKDKNILFLNDLPAVLDFTEHAPEHSALPAAIPEYSAQLYGFARQAAQR